MYLYTNPFTSRSLSFKFHHEKYSREDSEAKTADLVQSFDQEEAQQRTADQATLAAEDAEPSAF